MLQLRGEGEKGQPHCMGALWLGQVHPVKGEPPPLQSCSLKIVGLQKVMGELFGRKWICDGKDSPLLLADAASSASRLVAMVTSSMKCFGYIDFLSVPVSTERKGNDGVGVMRPVW